MKGFIFILILYVFVFLWCSFFKYFITLYKKNKKGSDYNSAPKIYYVKNLTPKKQKPKTVKPDIVIKGSIIEKDKLN